MAIALKRLTKVLSGIFACISHFKFGLCLPAIPANQGELLFRISGKNFNFFSDPVNVVNIREQGKVSYTAFRTAEGKSWGHFTGARMQRLTILDSLSYLPMKHKRLVE